MFRLLLALSIGLAAFASPDAQAAAFEWEAVGNTGFSTGTAQYTDIAFDSGGTPYVVYTDGDQTDQATVKKYNGTSWETVGSAGFTTGTATNVHIAIDSGGAPYVFFKDGSSGGLATVMRYNGASWQVVGSEGFSNSIIYSSDIAIDGNDVPYVVYVDSSTSYKLVMKKWDGASWVTVGSAGFSSSNASSPGIAFDSGNTPYVIYSDSDATVQRFNGSSWVTVGIGGFADGFVQGVDIALDSNDIPYAVYVEDSTSEVGEYKTTVKKYDGSWQSVGSERFSVRAGGAVDISIDSNGAPYVAYTEDSTAQTMVSVYDAPNDVWDLMGGGSVSPGASNHTSIAIDSNDRPYVVYMDGANGNRATVQRAVQKYAVSYDGNGNDGGNAPADALYEDNASVTVSGNTGSLTRTGYTFAGWNTAADGNGTDYAGGDTFTMGASDVTLYAQWTINDYTVSYAGNGNDGGSAPGSSNHVYNSSVTVSGNTGALSRTGYTFAGWNTAADGSGTDFVGGDTFTMGASNVTLYAQWTINDYTVSYAGNGNDGGSAPGSSNHVYNSSVTVSGNTGALSRTGYTFAGWNTASDGSGADFAGGDTFTMGASDVTLYAQWTINDYTVSYAGNGSDGGSAPGSSNHVYNTSVSVSGNTGNLSRTGYTFAGWNTASDGSGAGFVGGDTFTMGASNVTLYAQWAINDYTVSFDGNGNDEGSAPGAGSHEYDSSVTVPGSGTLSRTGYTFAGWNTAADGSGTDYAGGATFTMGASDVTLYAQWAINDYTVSFDGNGNDEGSAPGAGSHEYDSSVTVPGSGTLSRTGYTFAGWNTAADGSGTDYAGGDTFTMGASDVTLYAQWTTNAYDIDVTASPEEGGNASCDPNPVDHDGSSTCTASAAEGYTFTDWSGDCTGSDCVLEDVTGPQSITANFEPISYAVTPSAGDGGSISPVTAQTINHGDSVDFTLTPDTGYSIGEVRGSCTGSLSGDVYTAGPVEADCGVEASFTQDPADGLCGAADAGVLTEAPSENLCEAGNASEVTGEGPWDWSCQGVAGGADAQCSAELERHAIATSVTPVGAGTLTCDPDPVGHGRDSVCTADAGEQFIFEGFEGDCDAVDAQSCTLTAVTSARSVVARFLPVLVGDSPNADRPGEIQAVASGGGSGQWIFDHAESQGYIAPENAGSPPPEGLEFPFGLFGFVLVDGEPGAKATVVITYPEPLPANTAYWKYDLGADDWYELPPEHYQVSGNTVTLQLTDGGAGDQDGVADGRIVDPGGLVITQAAGDPVAVPVLSRHGLLVLAALVLVLGGFHFGRYRVSQGNRDTHDLRG
ncbi:InlB B-repeat-containing protein [Arhodomonas sp. AD133]|uniref:InlB B-repeat-containing protein n=1 Tax=Arhodomonas sp. AD133 TaxID=3415009 RepID=UPI003EBC03C4